MTRLAEQGRVAGLAIHLTPEQARNIRAHAWAYVFRCHEMKKAARPGSPDDAEGNRIAKGGAM